jgi:hypothetical protein
MPSPETAPAEICRTYSTESALESRKTNPVARIYADVETLEGRWGGRLTVEHPSATTSAHSTTDTVVKPAFIEEHRGGVVKRQCVRHPFHIEQACDICRLSLHTVMI